MLKIAFLASGSGTNFSAVMEKISTGELNVQVEFVLSNNSRSGALQKAQERQVKTFHVSSITEGGEDNVPTKMIELLSLHKIDLLVLAGYMKKLPLKVIEFMPHRIINIHPALLPAFGGPGFYGDRIHQAVLKMGCQYTGVTIHSVDGAYDEGPIICQRSVKVKPGMSLDDLRNSVLAIEYDSLWRVVLGFAEGTLKSGPGGISGITDFQTDLEKSIETFSD